MRQGGALAGLTDIHFVYIGLTINAYGLENNKNPIANANIALQNFSGKARAAPRNMA